MRHAWVCALLLFGSACRTDTSKTTDTGGVDFVGDYALILTLEADESAAGSSVTYNAEVLSTDGESTPVEVVLASDIEPVLEMTTEAIFPTIAGEHLLTTELQWEGENLTAEAPLTVVAADAYDVDLILEDYAVSAGIPLGYAVTASDMYGNALDPSLVSLVIDPDAVSVEDGTLVTTIPGTYLASASLDGVEDVESFVVSPGEAANIELELSSTELELYETTTASVSITDIYGNATNDSWTLTVEGDGAVTISYANVTFYEEGYYSVTATVDANSKLSDTVGYFLIDSTGPDVDFFDPERGDWVYGEVGTITGQVTDEWSGIGSLTINGETINPDEDGYFEVDVTYDFGMNIIETVAVDGDGNETTDTRALLAGDFLPYGEEADGGLLVRINEGDGGLDEFTALADGLIDASALDDLIPNPVFSEESSWEECVDPCFGLWGGCEFCWDYTWYALDLSVQDPSMGEVEIELDPTTSGTYAGGTIYTTLTLYDLSIDWESCAVLLDVDLGCDDGDVTADSITVWMELYPYASSGEIQIDIVDVVVSSAGFDFGWDSFIGDVIDTIGLGSSLDSTVQGYLEDALEDAVQDAVPELIADLFNDLEIATDIDLNGATYTVQAAPRDLDVDDDGIVLVLGSSMSGAWTIDGMGEGSLYGEYDEPTWTTDYGMAMGLGLDFLNQAMYAMWGGGLIDMEMTGEDLGVDASDLSIVFPDLTALSLGTTALLPPVLVPGTGVEMLDLQLGDLLLTLYNGDPVEGNEFLQVYTSVIAGLDMEANSDGSALVTGIGEATMYFDVVYPDNNTFAASDTEGLLQLLVPMLLPMFTELLGELPIPEIDGFGLTGVSVDLLGPDSGYVTLMGDMALTF